MSAREELRRWCINDDVDAVLDAYRDEVLREAAETIRIEAEDWDGWPEKKALDAVIKLIDPDMGDES